MAAAAWAPYAPEGHATPPEVTLRWSACVGAGQRAGGILLGRRGAWVASATAGSVVCQQLGGVVVHDAARDLLGKLERVELAE
jgi:hypothetical protein